MTKEDLLNRLKTEELSITFLKVNNEVRTLICTLDETKIPKVEVNQNDTKPKKERKQSSETICVFCTDINEWRSFRFTSVISVEHADSLGCGKKR